MEPNIRLPADDIGPAPRHARSAARPAARPRSRPAAPATLRQRQCAGRSGPAALLRQHCSGSTAPAALLRQHCSGSTGATARARLSAGPAADQTIARPSHVSAQPSPDTGAAVIQTTALTKRYPGAVTALDARTGSVAPGITVLVGANGLLLLDEPTVGLDPAGRNSMLELISRIGTEFGISIVVASHLLGEIERICDHLVAIDGGRLLRADTMTSMTQVSQVLVIEVDEGSELLLAELGQRGLEPRPYQRALLVRLEDDATYDTVRDAIAALGLPLNRLEQRRRRLAELLRREPAQDPQAPDEHARGEQALGSEASAATP